MSDHKNNEQYSLIELEKLYNEYGITEDEYNNLVNRFEKFRGIIDGYKFYETPLVILEKENLQKGGNKKVSKSRRTTKSRKLRKSKRITRSKKVRKTSKSRK
jgi:hypothetical protein